MGGGAGGDSRRELWYRSRRYGFGELAGSRPQSISSGSWTSASSRRASVLVSLAIATQSEVLAKVVAIYLASPTKVARSSIECMD
jgi:hypothetical protein